MQEERKNLRPDKPNEMDILRKVYIDSFFWYEKFEKQLCNKIIFLFNNKQ